MNDSVALRNTIVSQISHCIAFHNREKHHTDCFLGRGNFLKALCFIWLKSDARVADVNRIRSCEDRGESL